jgi:cytochrome P450
MRKLTAHAFTDIALKEQWPLISRHLHTFVSKLGSLVAQSPDQKIDLNKWSNALTFDVITELSFGEPLGALHSNGRDAYIDDFFTSCKIFPIIPTSWEYPIVDSCLKLMMKIPSLKRIQEMGYLSTKAKVQKRIAAATTTKKVDFMTYV